MGELQSLNERIAKRIVQELLKGAFLNALDKEKVVEVNVCSNCLAILGDWDCCTVDSGERFPNGWNIAKEAKPIPDRRFDFDFWHDDHEGDSNLCGTAANKADAVEQIKEIEKGLSRDLQSY